MSLRSNVLRWVAVLAVFGVAAALPAGCSAEEPRCSPDLASIQTAIFERSCVSASCHGGPEPGGGLDLTANVAAQLVDVASVCDGSPRVQPGSPEQSLLYRKLADRPAPCGDPMPSTTRLSDGELACVRGWIESLSASGCEKCGGQTCIDLSIDRNHCGRCGNACPEGVSCVSGACDCGGGLVSCGGPCIDPQVNPANCGACGNACPPAASCVSGVCVCAPGTVACGERCADTSSDPEHCGGCNHACAQGDVCLHGVCSSDCGSLTQCTLSCVDLQTNQVHCGQCGRTCSAGATCLAGACVCPGEQQDCGAGCVDVSHDLSNCGQCGNACGIGTTCSDGSCVCTGGSVSFSADVQPIFTESCAGSRCHSGIRPQGELDLSAGRAHAELVGERSTQCTSRLLVAPNDAKSSYLVDKLLGQNLCLGTQMPKRGVSLARDQIDAIVSWICHGAAED